MTIVLDLESDGFRLRDKFEWDIVDEDNDPKLFAEILVKDLNLP